LNSELKNQDITIRKSRITELKPTAKPTLNRINKAQGRAAGKPGRRATEASRWSRHGTAGAVDRTAAEMERAGREATQEHRWKRMKVCRNVKPRGRRAATYFADDSERESCKRLLRAGRTIDYSRRLCKETMIW
jgi:hypothetical protein